MPDYDSARQRYHADCARAKAEGRPEPRWWAYVGDRPAASTAMMDDWESHRAGDGSMWQV